MQDTLAPRVGTLLRERLGDAPAITATLGVAVTAEGELELHLAGRLHAGCLADVRTGLLGAISAGSGTVHLRLGGAELGDAASVGLVVEAHHLARRCGRRLALEELSPRSERLLRAVRLLPRGRRPATGAVEGVAALTV